jgi:Cu(I)/Ag(I) efflux system protein CusF
MSALAPIQSACSKQDADMKNMESKSMDMGKQSSGPADKAMVHQAAGTVKATDPAKGTVILAHGPVKSLNWPSMTMRFTVKDKMLFDKLVADKKVEFEFTQQGSEYVVTAVK